MSIYSRAAVLKSVTKPLQVLALAMLVMESTLVVLALKLPDRYTGWLVGAIIGFILIFIGVATYIEIQTLRAGTWLLPYAALFAVDLIGVLDGYLDNLPPAEQREAWASLADVLLEFDDPEAPRAYRKFRSDVAEHLKIRKVNTKKLLIGTQGPINE